MTEIKQVQTDSAEAGPAPRSPKHLPTLTSLRFLAAFLVFGTHAGLESLFADRAVGTAVNDFFAPGGRYGVSFFFVLSGFVLTWAARPGEPARKFWRARVAKIFPLHVVTWAMAAVLLVSVAGQRLDWTVLTVNFFLLHAWVPRADVMVSLNSPSWSLCCEALFYLAFPLLIALVRRIRPMLLWPAAIVSMVVVVCTPLIAGLLVATEPKLPGYGVSLAEAWFVKEFPPAHLFEFIVGILVAQILLSGKWIRLGFGPAAVLAAAGYLLSTQVPLLYTFGAATILPTALLIGACAQADATGAATWGLRARGAVWLGETSFAFYMAHWLIVSFGHRLIGPGKWSTLAALGLIVLAFAASLGAAWALHAWVEQPVMRAWGRSRATRPPHPRSALRAGARHM